MKKIYKIANINIMVETFFEFNETQRYSNFSIDDDRFDVCFKFIKSKLELMKENNICSEGFVDIYYDKDTVYRVYNHGYKNSEYACIEYNVNDKSNYICHVYDRGEEFLSHDYRIFALLGLEKILNDFNSIYLHASFIKYNYHGILFTAPCGTGKSTQANLWNKHEKATIINGDKVAIRKVDNVWKAFGLPYAGSSEFFINDFANIKSIVVLRQSKENIIKKLNPKEAFKYILSETTVNYWDENFMNCTVDLVKDIVENIPVFILYCNISIEAVETLKDAIIY